MAVDPAVLNQVRDYVGSRPDDAAIADALSFAENDPKRAALSILKRRRADLTADPGKLSLDQDYSRETTATQVKALDDLIASLTAEIETDTGDDLAGDDLHTVTVAQARRADDAWCDRGYVPERHRW